ncbi:MAG TPA: adenylyltransferase/cytidyltransferase family protein [Planctomycetota bacterium]|nr:adenylyltransferase/cytidyltransferase family protein [Planctomycetota bacterium]
MLRPERKIILDPEDLAARVAELRGRGLTIVTANGCFDLLHVGHIRYLFGAKAKGDVLIVAVNTDESMKMIKPEKRIVTPDDERFELIAAIEAVDYVVPLRERTPESLLRLLRPHVHTKGTDYTLEMIPERFIVEEHGGRVEIVGDPKDHSSTAIRQMLS